MNMLARYVPGKHSSNINKQIVYTATTKIHFVRIVTILTLLHFISHWTILSFKHFINLICITKQLLLKYLCTLTK